MKSATNRQPSRGRETDPCERRTSRCGRRRRRPEQLLLLEQLVVEQQRPAPGLGVVLATAARLDGWGWRTAAERSHNAHMSERDVAIVLSGGGMNGVLLDGLLTRASAPARSGRGSAAFDGTSAGALAGAMAALDRLDDLEDFLLELQPGDVSGRSASGGCR